MKPAADHTSAMRPLHTAPQNRIDRPPTVSGADAWGAMRPTTTRIPGPVTTPSVTSMAVSPLAPSNSLKLRLPNRTGLSRNGDFVAAFSLRLRSAQFKGME